MVKERPTPPNRVVTLLACFRKTRFDVVDGCRVLVIGLMARNTIRIERRERTVSIIYVATLARYLSMSAKERKPCSCVHVLLAHFGEGLRVMT